MDKRITERTRVRRNKSLIVVHQPGTKIKKASFEAWFVVAKGGIEPPTFGL